MLFLIALGAVTVLSSAFLVWAFVCDAMCYPERRLSRDLGKARRR